MHKDVNVRKLIQDSTEQINLDLTNEFGKELQYEDVQVRMSTPTQINYRWLTRANFPEATGSSACEYLAKYTSELLQDVYADVVKDVGVELRIDFRSRDSSNPGNKILTYLITDHDYKLQRDDTVSALNSCRVRDIITGREFDWTPPVRGLEPPGNLIKISK